MSVLSSLARRHTSLTDREIDHLHRLVGEWQLLADLNFADLLLFAPMRGDHGYVILAQVRPFPAQTLYQEDMVGTVLKRRPAVALAFGEERIVREGDPEWREGTPIREEAIPVRCAGRAVAVISSEQNLATARTPSKLELSYLQAAGELAQMIADGDFPFYEGEPEQELTPRVGDGFMRLDAGGIVTYISPNAISAYRRLGITANFIDEPIGAAGLDESATMQRLKQARPVFSEIESNGAWVLRRFLPIVHKGEVHGALGLVRDVTEMRRRDRMLLLKDATIREIHHRVKNNLQTVASLLRMQTRRVGSAEAKAALEESIRRISSIALVHETLSQDSNEMVAFDDVTRRVLDMVSEGLVSPERPVHFSVTGSAGEISSQVATPLALILTELCQNAVDHAFGYEGGRVGVELDRRNGRLRMTVTDNGKGLPEGFSLEKGSNLGFQIVRTLVESELGGTIDVSSEPGARVVIDFPLEKAQ